jgi:hypothetical protein
MTLYTIANYLHVLGAMGIVAALCLEWTIVRRLRTAESVEQAREWLGLAGIQRVIGSVSLTGLLVSGLYMAVTRWGGAGWVTVGLLALGLIGALGAYNGIRLDRIRKALVAQTGQLSAELRERIRHFSFLVSIQVRAAMLLGVVFVMTGKLDLNASLMTLGLAVLVGLASALPAWRQTASGTRAVHLP